MGSIVASTPHSTRASNSTELQPPNPVAANMIELWALDSNFAFLNHGCFGARPNTVLEAQWRHRQAFEARPVDWLERQRAMLIDQAKIAPGKFLGMTPANFGFVANATGGINAVLRSMPIKAGDELLTTNHVYNAVRQTMKHVALERGATYVECPVALPLKSPQEVADAIKAALNAQTRIVVVDHVTSPTAVVFPIAQIIELCHALGGGIEVLVDGAHAPGMLRLDVEQIGAEYYVGNLHKWVCAPPGAGFLWVRPDRQRGIHPPTISHFWNEGFNLEFNWQATRDISPWLCATDAIEFMAKFGWDKVMAHNHQMAVWAQAMLCEKWNVEPATPIDGSLLGSMATVELPQQEKLRAKFADIQSLRDALYREHRIEVAIIDWGGKWWCRASCQIYNSPEHFERLADAALRLA